jgi:hypothetical protein
MGLDAVQLEGQFGSLKTALEKKAGIKESVEALKTTTKAHFKEIDPLVSKKMMAELLRLYQQNVPKNQLPSVFALIEKNYKNDFNAFANEVFKTSPFVTEANAMAFLNKPNLKVFKKDYQT